MRSPAIGTPVDTDPEYLSIEQAARYLGVTAAEVRRLLRQYGLGEFTRASMARQVLIRRTDLDSLKPGPRQGRTTRAAADARRRRTG